MIKDQGTAWNGAVESSDEFMNKKKDWQKKAENRL